MSIAIMYVIFNFHVLEHMQFIDSALQTGSYRTGY